MLFGHQNDNNTQQPVVGNDVQPPTNPSGVNPLAVDPDTGVSLPVAPEELTHDGSETSILDQPESAPVFSVPADTPSVDATVSTDTPTLDEAPSDDVLHATGDDDLLKLKQQALQQLSPLVDHLEQSPEEKFRTTMMMIQSSDNQNLIKDAYDAAQKISDDKVRAQALLDIVNEINYFTQHNAN